MSLSTLTDELNRTISSTFSTFFSRYHHHLSSSHTIQAISDGYLRPGDTLVCDNARVHTGSHSILLIDQILSMGKIRMELLPAYSPELNPCELVFAEVKHMLRNTLHNDDLALYVEIVIAFASVPHMNMAAYYQRCCREFGGSK